ncbi:phage major capsid protein [Bifidobacterium mongoliense]|uniref:phage major capsid protein n=1 Tax=Bifidobacterium mongoliense TaxID=518643 RepID=UPI0030EB1B8D
MSIVTTDAKGYFSDEVFPAEDVVPDSLVMQPDVTTVTGAPEGDVPVVRVPYVDADPTVGFVAEGADIPESDPHLAEILVHTRKLALIASQSNESYAYAGTAGSVATSMQRAITLKGDAALLNSPTDPTGLWATTGITDAGEVTNTFDPFIDAIAGIEANNGAASSILVHPKSWAVLSKIKYTDGALQLGSPTQQSSRTLFGLPVHVTASIAEGHALVVDSREIVAAVGPIQLTSSSDAAFNSDSVLHRATWRIGWSVVHPERLAKLTITGPAKG